MSKGKKLGKNYCAVTQLDWSVDGSAIKTNDTSYEILYYDVGSGQQDTAGATTYKDETWHTFNCIFGSQSALDCQ